MVRVTYRIGTSSAEMPTYENCEEPFFKQTGGYGGTQLLNEEHLRTRSEHRGCNRVMRAIKQRGLDLSPLRNMITGAIFFVLLFAILSMNFYAEAADKDNCLMCHKYRFLGRVDESGRSINYHVPEEVYHNTVHRNVSCRECHTYIKKIPHDPVEEEVNCANLCHIKTPFSQERFSHEKIIEVYKKSAHAPQSGDSALLKEAKPNCKFCHFNPMYTRVSEERIDYHESLRRCLNCHQEKGVTQAYIHMTHRLRKKTSRSPQEIVELCAKCHQDVELMKKLNVSKRGITAVETYKQSIHGKSVTLGSEVAADCVSCHASNKLHDIYKKDDRRATVEKKNLKKTCSQCHARTNSWFVQVAVHPSTEREDNPIVFFANLSLSLALYGTVFGLVGLMLLEIFGRRKDGIKFLLKNGTSWRGKPKQKEKKKK